MKKKSYCLKAIQVVNVLWMITPDFLHKTEHTLFLVSSSCSILDFSMGGIWKWWSVSTYCKERQMSQSPPVHPVCSQSKIAASLELSENEKLHTCSCIYQSRSPWITRCVKKRAIIWNAAIPISKILKGICLGCTLQEVCEKEWAMAKCLEFVRCRQKGLKQLKERIVRTWELDSNIIDMALWNRLGHRGAIMQTQKHCALEIACLHGHLSSWVANFPWREDWQTET